MAFLEIRLIFCLFSQPSSMFFTLKRRLLVIFNFKENGKVPKLTCYRTWHFHKRRLNNFSLVFTVMWSQKMVFSNKKRPPTSSEVICPSYSSATPPVNPLLSIKHSSLVLSLCLCFSSTSKIKQLQYHNCHSLSKLPRGIRINNLQALISSQSTS